MLETEVLSTRIPVEDCYLSIDLVLQSSDGVRFGAHKMNLEQYSAGFPTADSTVFDNIVTLSEKASVLGPLLHFMHNTRQPDLSKLSFDTLGLLAEAVEKYMVFSAMQVCNIYMRFVQLVLLFDPRADTFFSQKSNNNISIACILVCHQTRLRRSGRRGRSSADFYPIGGFFEPCHQIWRTYHYYHSICK